MAIHALVLDRTGGRSLRVYEESVRLTLKSGETILFPAYDRNDIVLNPLGDDLHVLFPDGESLVLDNYLQDMKLVAMSGEAGGLIPGLLPASNPESLPGADNSANVLALSLGLGGDTTGLTDSSLAASSDIGAADTDLGVSGADLRERIGGVVAVSDVVPPLNAVPDYAVVPPPARSFRDVEIKSEGFYDAEEQGRTAGGAVVLNTPPPQSQSFAASFSIGTDVSTVTEGGDIVFTVIRTGNTSRVQSVTFATENIDTDANDYAVVGGTPQILEFAVGQTVTTLTVHANSDSLFEERETFNALLSNPTDGATIAVDNATATIVDDATSQPVFSISSETPATVEGGDIVFTVTRTGDITSSESVTFTTGGQSATDGLDYDGVTEVLTFSAGQTLALVSVHTNTDSLFNEGNETFQAHLSDATGGAAIGVDAADATISDIASRFHIEGPASGVREGGSLLFTVTRAGDLSAAQSVDFTTSDGTANAGLDYISQNGVLQFAAGQSVAYITVQSISDTLQEGDESVFVTISNPTGSSDISGASSSGFIQDNFSQVTIGSELGYSQAARWADYDGDGDLDLFVANDRGGSLPNRLFRNDGNNVFTPVSVTGLTDIYDSRDGDWSDIDGDGDLDLFVTRYNLTDNSVISNLFRNDGSGQFTDITAASGIATGRWAFQASWGDYDGDGRPDLFVGRYDVQNGYTSNQLWHNDGNGHFSLATISGAGSPTALPSAPKTIYREGSWVDYDRDGDLDLQVLGDNVAQFWRNDGNGQFTRVNLPFSGSGIHVSEAVWGDFNNDGRLDVFVPNLGFGGTSQNQLWQNDGHGHFTNADIPGDLLNSTRAEWGDYDNDGDADLYVPNYFDQPNALWQNNANPDQHSFLKLDLTNANGVANLAGAIVDLFDAAGTRVATRIYDGITPLTFNGLTGHDYSVSVSYFRDADGTGPQAGQHVVVGPAGLPGVTVTNPDFAHLDPAQIGGTVHLAADGGYAAAGANLHGTSGNDLFIGGVGDDRFTGNGGSDTYLFHANHGHDTVTDFTTGSGAGQDALDIADLLVGYAGAPSTSNGSGGLDRLIADGFLKLTQNGADAEIRIDRDGGGNNFQATADITLAGVDLSTHLLNDHNVIATHS